MVSRVILLNITATQILPSQIMYPVSQKKSRPLISAKVDQFS